MKSCEARTGPVRPYQLIGRVKLVPQSCASLTAQLVHSIQVVGAEMGECFNTPGPGGQAYKLQVGGLQHKLTCRPAVKQPKLCSQATSPRHSLNSLVLAHMHLLMNHAPTPRFMLQSGSPLMLPAKVVSHHQHQIKDAILQGRHQCEQAPTINGGAAGAAVPQALLF